jgi:nondiscriminating aspartyl-tRNA synthetase
MERVLIGDLHNHIEKEVTVQGWVDVRRDHGKMVFMDLRDRSGLVQAVALPNHPEAVEVAQTVRPEYVVSVQAIVNKRPDRMVKADQQNGDIELELLAVEVLSKAQELPFDKDAEFHLDTKLNSLPLTARAQKAKAVYEVQSTLIQAYREALQQEGFTEFQCPALVGGDAEGGSEVFRVEYFDDNTAYLATSPQLYKQIMVGVFERVFTTAKVFRAERSSTSRHLSEIVQMDFEMGFIKDHRDVMDMLERVMRHVMNRVREKHEGLLIDLGVELPLLPEKSFPVMSLREAQGLIKKETGEDKTEEPDLEPEDERWLCEYAKKEYGSDFMFVTHFPTSKRAFYTYKDDEDPYFSKSFDLLFKGLEINSGSQRIHDYDELVEKMKSKDMDPEAFSFYLQAFKYGMPPHGGCSTGLERLTARLLNIGNVKEATLFPRDMNRIDTLLSE